MSEPRIWGTKYSRLRRSVSYRGSTRGSIESASTRFRADASHKMILNGWFLHRPDHWPPSSALDPLIVSFHLTREIVPSVNIGRIAPGATVLHGRGLDFLRRHEPIGARDSRHARAARICRHPCVFLRLSHVDAACDPRRVRRATLSMRVDVPDAVFEYLSRRCDEPMIRLSHGDFRARRFRAVCEGGRIIARLRQGEGGGDTQAPLRVTVSRLRHARAVHRGRRGPLSLRWPSRIPPLYDRG